MTTSTYGRPASGGDPAFRRAMTFVVMTLFVPGSAHLVAGRKRLGRFLLRCWFVLVALGLLAGLLFLVKPGWLIGLGTTPWVLTLLRWGAIVVGLGWAAAIVHAYVLANPPRIERSRRLVAAGVTLAMTLVIMFPALFVSNTLQAQRDLVTGVFGEGSKAVGERVNILLLGGDAGDDRWGLRPDSINVASVDVASGRTVLFALPRNLQRAPFEPGSALAEEFPNGFVCPDNGCMLNGVYTYALDHPELFPAGATEEERGTSAMMNVVGTTLGLDLDFYVMVDLAGFEKIVDALGGITLEVTERVPIGGNADNPNAPVEGWIEPGVQHLTGHQALWFSRSRAGTTDYDRMARQRCVLGAILREADPANVLLNYTELANAAQVTLTTDIPQGSLSGLVEVALRAKAQPVTSVQFVPPLVPDTSHPDFQLIRATVEQAIEASENAPDPAATTASAGGSVGPTTGTPDDPDDPDATDPGATTTTVPEGPVDVSEVCSYG